MSEKCKFESVSPCSGRVAYGACLKHRETFGSAPWGWVEDRDVEIAHLRARIAALEEALKSTARLGGKRIAELEAALR